MKSNSNLRYFKLLSFEANILPISADHNDFYTISFDTNDANDIYLFINMAIKELENCNSEEISSAYIIANYYSIFKSIHTKLIAEITYSKQNLIVNIKESLI